MTNELENLASFVTQKSDAIPFVQHLHRLPYRLLPSLPPFPSCRPLSLSFLAPLRSPLFRAPRVPPCSNLLTPFPTTNNIPPSHPCVAGLLGDLHVYEPANGTWTDLTETAGGTWPIARFHHGLTSAGGLIYLFGGSGGQGFTREIE
jgi:hypothetical protein